MSRDPLADDLEALARARGLGLDDVLAAIRPGVESLASRLRALAATLTPDDATPPDRRDPGTRR